MSKGPGRLQRRIMALTKQAPERCMSRRELEEALVGGEDGCSSSNLLRAIKGLERMHAVRLYDAADKDSAFVSLPQAAKPVPESKLAELLAEIGGGK